MYPHLLGDVEIRIVNSVAGSSRCFSLKNTTMHLNLLKLCTKHSGVYILFILFPLLPSDGE